MNDQGAALIVGATSPIARAAAIELAQRGWRIALAGRDMEELARLSADLQLRTDAEVKTFAYDALDLDGQGDFLHGVARDMEGLKGVLVAVGAMPPQEALNEEPDRAAHILSANYTGPALLLQHAAKIFDEQGLGWLAAIGSVAGDRGRAKNYLYGSAKGGISLLLGGLRQRLAGRGVTVTTIKPGFVDTGMTFGMEGVKGAADPGEVGKAAADAILKGKDVVYIPAKWRLIMFIVRSIPERIFKNLKF